MSGKRIEFRSGYKHQLAKDFRIKTGIRPSKPGKLKNYIKLDVNGSLLVKAGYAWDGTSGPVIDDEENLRASLVHDALYQLMREKRLLAKKHKDAADRLFQKMCVQDGVSKAEAKLYYTALKLFGSPATRPENRKKVRRAPR